MHIASTLRRDRDEIAATIAAHEARIDAARIDLAMLERAAWLFGREAERDETVIPLDMSQVALPLARSKRANDQAASLSEAMDFGERQFTGKVAHSAVRAPREIPEEFFI
jgi:uncharacterized protein YbjT (DUF2867 family)